MSLHSQLSVEVISVASIGREVHVGRATVALCEAVPNFNSFVPFAVQLTHYDRTGVRLVVDRLSPSAQHVSCVLQETPLK